MKNIDYALKYAELGWSIVPCHHIIKGECTCKDPNCSSPGKHPRIRWKDYQLIKADKETISKWWQRWPGANIGLITGAISSTIVLDVDEHNMSGIETLRKRKLVIPMYARSQTGGGGYHFFYKHPGKPVRNWTEGKGLLPGVDFRGDGGFIVLPPSSHISGDNYTWIEKPEKLSDLYDAPKWLLDMIFNQKSKAMAPGDVSRPNSVILDNNDLFEGANHDDDPKWIEKMMNPASEGSRNSICAQLAGYWMKRLNDDHIAVKEILLNWNMRNNPPLDDREVLGVITSIKTCHDREKATNPLGVIFESITRYKDGSQETNYFDIKILGYSKQIRVTVEELTSQAKLRNRILSVTGNLLLKSIKRGEFDEIITSLLERVEVIQIEREMDNKTTILDIIYKQTFNASDDFEMLDDSVIVDENDTVYFKLITLMGLCKDYVKLSRNEIASILRESNFDYKLFSRNSRKIKCWYISLKDLINLLS